MKEQKSREYADWLHKNLEEQLGHKCAKHDMYYRNEDIHQAFDVGWDEALKSQWVSVEEKMPEIWQDVLVFIIRDTDVQIHKSTYFGEKDWSFGGIKIIAWMPIPSFDEILEANKDVLKRLKDK